MKVVAERLIHSIWKMLLPLVLLLGQTSLVAAESADTFRVTVVDASRITITADGQSLETPFGFRAYLA